MQQTYRLGIVAVAVFGCIQLGPRAAQSQPSGSESAESAEDTSEETAQAPGAEGSAEQARDAYAAVVCGSEGITLRWYSGRVETVVDEPAEECRVDNHAGAVWYRDENGDVAVYDRQTDETATIATDIPTKVRYGVAYDTLHLVPKFGAWLVVFGTADTGSPVDIEGGRMEKASPLDAGQIRERMSLVGEEKLAELTERAANRAEGADCDAELLEPCEYRGESSDPPDRVGGVPSEPCEQNRCGRTEVVPHTPYLLVTTAFECGDLCHATQKLYDPEAEVFVNPETGDGYDDPEEVPEWRGGVFSPDGEFIVRESSVVQMGEGILLELESGAGAGWLQTDADASKQ